jgi:hypothetical protein
MIRRRLRKTLQGQGIGRHSRDEITAIGIRSIDAMAAYLGDKPFFMGSAPGRHRRHDVRLRGQCDLSAVRIGFAAGGRKP